jgi:sulfoxide reductase catalytic subunit YedY
MATREAFAQSGQKLRRKPNPSFVVMDKQTAFKDANSYNNYYEFSTDKSDPARYAGSLKTRPWTIAIEGEVNKPMTLDIDRPDEAGAAGRAGLPLRCVEGWSMVMPWIGYSAVGADQKGRTEQQCQVRRVRHPGRSKQMPGLGSRC